MEGTLAAARLLREAQRLLVMVASPAAEYAGWLWLAAVLRCPGTPEPELLDPRDRVALAELEMAGAAA